MLVGGLGGCSCRRPPVSDLPQRPNLSQNEKKKHFFEWYEIKLNKQPGRAAPLLFFFLFFVSVVFSGSVEGGGGVSLLPILWLLFSAIHHLCFFGQLAKGEGHPFVGQSTVN